MLSGEQGQETRLKRTALFPAKEIVRNGMVVPER